jgi:hypothetical protein
VQRNREAEAGTGAHRALIMMSRAGYWPVITETGIAPHLVVDGGHIQTGRRRS